MLTKPISPPQPCWSTVLPDRLFSIGIGSSRQVVIGPKDLGEEENPMYCLGPMKATLNSQVNQLHPADSSRKPCRLIRGKQLVP